MAIVSKIIRELEIALANFPIEKSEHVFQDSISTCVILLKDKMPEIRLPVTELFKREGVLLPSFEPI